MDSIIKIMSWNVRGLNNKFKRAAVFHCIRQTKPHIVLLQETHLEGSKILSLRKHWIQRTIHSTYSTYARGVSILISKTIACTIHQVISDPGGRYVVVSLEVCNQKFLLVNIYLPPPFQVKLLYDLMVQLAPFLHMPMLLMGDYNAILDGVLDSSNAARAASVDLCSWAAMAGMTEIWRWKHPGTVSYSHLSATHKSSARIDLAFGNDLLLKHVFASEYLSGGVSDHNPLLITLAFPSGIKKKKGVGNYLQGGCWRSRYMPRYKSR